MDTHASHPHHRVEDFRLVTGTGKYAADWSLPGQLYAHFVRSDRAHAEIVSVDTAKAAKHPGVKRVYTGKDALRAGYNKFLVMLNTPGRNGEHIRKPRRPALATDKVRHVGDAVAMVVADSAAAAQDAAELIEVEYRDLPAVVSPEKALDAGAPQLHKEAPGNLAYDYETGNEQAVAEAFEKAAHVTRLKLEVTRVAPSPMELRGCTVTLRSEGGCVPPVRVHPGHQHDAQAGLVRDGRSGGQDLRPRAGRRRQLRTAQRGLSRILHADAGGERAGQARAVDIEPLGRLHDRHPRPRQHRQGRACARQGREDSWRCGSTG